MAKIFKNFNQKIFFGFALAFIFFLSFLYSAEAHERWVDHALVHPAHKDVFFKWSWEMVSVIGRTLLLLFFLLALWNCRNFLGKKIGIFRSNFFQFLFDKPYAQNWFLVAEKIIHKLIIRAPALVLIYSASNHCLLMPSFPVESPLLVYAQFLQLLLAVMVLLEIFLPVVGYAIVAIFIYFNFHYGFMVAVDAFPLLAIAYVYITMPFSSKKNELVLSESQITWARQILGLSFILLGLMKIFNHELMIGVIDHYPQVTEDFMLRLFSVGTNPDYVREWFTFGFGMSEMLTGVLLMTGIFTRAISLYAAFIFTKLMLYDFGWPEVPHLYPISILLLVASSKKLPEELVEKKIFTSEYRMKMLGAISYAKPAEEFSDG